VAYNKNLLRLGNPGYRSCAFERNRLTADTVKRVQTSQPFSDGLGRGRQLDLGCLPLIFVVFHLRSGGLHWIKIHRDIRKPKGRHQFVRAAERPKPKDHSVVILVNVFGHYCSASSLTDAGIVTCGSSPRENEWVVDGSRYGCGPASLFATGAYQ
jgi:hypothetical protein